MNVRLASLAGSDPTAWYGGKVTEVDGEELALRYHDGAVCRLWRHGGFDLRVRLGATLPVSELWSLLSVPDEDGWVQLSVRVETASWRRDRLPKNRPQPFWPGIVDLSTGEGFDDRDTLAVARQLGQVSEPQPTRQQLTGRGELEAAAGPARAESLEDIPRRIVDTLGLEPAWSLTQDGGVGFVAAELGAWLTVRTAVEGRSTLRAELRVAVDVPDSAEARRVLEDANQDTPVGRWVHDAVTGTVAIVADVPIVGSAPVPYLVQAVAELVNAAYLSVPQRDLRGGKALTLVGGERRQRPHPLVGDLPWDADPIGHDDRVVTEVLNAARDLFAPALTGWSVEHQGNLTTADGDDGALVTVRSATLTAHGWGLEVVLTGGQPSGAEEGLSYAAALNRAESAPAHPRPAGGGWTCSGTGLQYRTFLTAALLDAAGPRWVAAQLLTRVVQEVASRAGADLVHDGDNAQTTVLTRPSWDGDPLAARLARRDPINDGTGHDGPARTPFLDWLNRGAGITDESVALYRSRLLPIDFEEEGVAAFLGFAEERIRDRAEATEDEDTDTS